VVDAETGGSLISDIRTSSGAFVGRGQDAVVAGIEKRIAEWSMIPEDHGEAIQVLRYEPGQEYRAHYDYFFHKQGEANNRVATALLYLSDVEEGGETVFPNTAVPPTQGNWSACAAQGVAVRPAKGDALLFWSMKVGGELDGAIGTLPLALLLRLWWQRCSV
jgi:prolyl 4-hydroxylase